MSGEKKRRDDEVDPVQADALGQALGMQVRLCDSGTGIHTAIAVRPRYRHRPVGGADRSAPVARDRPLRCCPPLWPVPITVIAVHLIPYSTDAAAIEAQILAGHIRRYAGHGVLAGDVNHPPLGDPDPNWEAIPPRDRSARTVLDEGPLRPNTKVARVLDRAELVDAAAHLAERTQNPSLRAHTGVHGLMRVDQAWLTPNLAQGLVRYERLDHAGLSDHFPILIDIDP